MKPSIWRAVILLVILIFIKTAVDNDSLIVLPTVLLIWADVVFIIYSLSQPPDIKKSNIDVSVNSVQKTVTKEGLSTKSKLTIGAIVIAAIIIFLHVNYLSGISLDFFLFVDKLLNTQPPGYLPIIAWALMGAFIGLILGVLVARKKYKLDFKWALVPIIIFLLIGSILFVINKPLDSETMSSFRNYYNDKTIVSASQFINVKATSNLPEYKNINYDAANLIDNDDNTAWVEDANNAGIGETITFAFNKIPTDNFKNLICTGFKIKNGYAKSNKLWSDYNRLQDFAVSINGTFKTYAKANTDLYSQWETISIAPMNIKYGDNIEVRINSVYYGIKKDKTAITELVPIVEYPK